MLLRSLAFVTLAASASGCLSIGELLGSEDTVGKPGSDGGSYDGAPWPEGPFVSSLAAGGDNTCAVIRDGETQSVRCWGANQHGQLGRGDWQLSAAPIVAANAGDMAALDGPTRTLALGEFFACALSEGKTLRCWGRNHVGQLGLGDRVDRTLPTALALEGQELLAVGALHACARIGSHSVRCWGFNGSGQLGVATTENLGDDEPPGTPPAVDLGDEISELALGSNHTCVLFANGTLRCFGHGDLGELGTGNLSAIGDDEHPTAIPVVNVGKPVVHVAAGGYRTCAILDGGGVRCWGMNASGELGLDNTKPTTMVPAALSTVGLSRAAVQLAMGFQHTCALLDDGNVVCWGVNSQGQLGYGHTLSVGDDEAPITFGPVDVGGSVTQIVAGRSHTCALLESGHVRCWGANDKGQLGYGVLGNVGDDEIPSSLEPVPVL